MVSRFAGQKIYVDASVIIYAIEASQLFPNLQTTIIEPMTRGELVLVTSWITLAEVLIKPMQIVDAILEKTYRQFLSPAPHFQLLPVDRSISEQAAAIRAQHGLKLPDSIHLATGIVANCSCFLTGDAEWSKSGLQIIDPSSL